MKSSGKVRYYDEGYEIKLRKNICYELHGKRFKGYHHSYCRWSMGLVLFNGLMGPTKSGMFILFFQSLLLC